MTDAVFPLLALNGRDAVCGQISQYNLAEAPAGPRLLWNLIVKQATVQGFLVFDFTKKDQTALTDLSAWVREGSLKYRENIVEGFKNVPQAFISLFEGANLGKQLVKIPEA